MTTTSLNEAAKAFSVHPRTIIRAIEDRENVYWNEGFDPDLDLTVLANAYSMQKEVLSRALKGTDTLLKPVEAARELKVPPRTFRWRRYKVAARKGGIVRYSRSQIVNEHLLRWDAEGTFLQI
jgi:hypothetical protein